VPSGENLNIADSQGIIMKHLYFWAEKVKQLK
jgi:hypothetical protein